MRVIGADELRTALPMAAAIDALEVAFRDEDPSGAGPVRSSVPTAAGSLLLMPASGSRGVGVKLVTLTDANPAAGLPLIHAAYILFDPTTQAPLAVLDGAALTALRTAAVSGLATRHLSRPDAHRLVVFGAGVQATAHVEAMTAVRPVDEVVVVSRTEARAARLIERAASAGLVARAGVPDDVAFADLVCTCTTSRVPVLEGAKVAAGAHLNAVGAYLPDTREVDTETVRRARVVVETREVANAEAGTVLLPIAEGAIDGAHVMADLHRLVGGVPVRSSPEDVTLFVSVGMAFEDLVVARAAVEALS
jgi:ornithine cyclodeaminase/alanine dehydrogenase-like protein (mu-crystallin family)